MSEQGVRTMTNNPVINWREQWSPGDVATFYYSLDPNDPSSEIAAELGHRSGQQVVVLSENDADGIRANVPTFRERADEAALLTYAVRFPDGHEADAFEDELHDEISP